MIAVCISTMVLQWKVSHLRPFCLENLKVINWTKCTDIDGRILYLHVSHWHIHIYTCSCVRQTDFFIHSGDGKGLHSFVAVLKNPFTSVCSWIGEKEEKGGESVIGLNSFSPPSLRGLIWLSCAISSFSLSARFYIFLLFLLSFLFIRHCCAAKTRVFHFFCFLHTSCSIPRSVLSSLPQLVCTKKNRIKLSRKFQKVLNRTFARLKRDEIGRTIWRPTFVRLIPPLCTFPLRTHHVLVLTPISHLLFPRKQEQTLFKDLRKRYSSKWILNKK